MNKTHLNQYLPPISSLQQYLELTHHNHENLITKTVPIISVIFLTSISFNATILFIFRKLSQLTYSVQTRVKILTTIAAVFLDYFYLIKPNFGFLIKIHIKISHKTNYPTVLEISTTFSLTQHTRAFSHSIRFIGLPWATFQMHSHPFALCYDSFA